jgi:hypothetical protein
VAVFPVDRWSIAHVPSLGKRIPAKTFLVPRVCSRSMALPSTLRCKAGTINTGASDDRRWEGVRPPVPTTCNISWKTAQHPVQPISSSGGIQIYHKLPAAGCGGCGMILPRGEKRSLEYRTRRSYNDPGIGYGLWRNKTDERDRANSAAGYPTGNLRGWMLRERDLRDTIYSDQITGGSRPEICANLQIAALRSP